MCHLNFLCSNSWDMFLNHTSLHTKNLVTLRFRFHLPGKHDSLSWYFGGYKIYQTPQISPTLVKNKEYHGKGAKIRVKTGELLKRGEIPIKPGRAWPGCNLGRARRVEPHEAHAHVRPALIVVF